MIFISELIVSNHFHQNWDTDTTLPSEKSRTYLKKGIDFDQFTIGFPNKRFSDDIFGNKITELNENFRNGRNIYYWFFLQNDQHR